MKMTFQSAIAQAPADAEFVGYKNIGGWVIIQRRSDGVWDTCANLNGLGCDIFIAGLSERKRSFWCYETKRFVTGNIEQLDR